MQQKRKKRILALGAALLALWSGLSLAWAAESLEVMAEGVAVNAEAIVIMEADSGRVLYAQNSDKKLAMASTTKIMTALLTLEQPELDSYFTVDEEAIQVEGTSMGLQKGDHVTLRQLAVGMLLPSGNDAAGAAAVRIAGSCTAFVEQMNQRAADLGMHDTHFVTPSGLDADGHYTTAYDLALLAREAISNEEFASICAQQKMQLSYGNPPYQRWLYNTNKLLERYPHAIGIKTGFTDNAGNCLVSAAQRDGVTLLIVTLRCKGDFNTHRDLYQRYFEMLSLTDLSELLPKQMVPVTGGMEKQVAAIPTRQPQVPLKAGEYRGLKVQLELPRFIYAPVEQGEVLGRVTVYSGADVVYTSDLVAEKSVLWLHPPKKEWTFFEQLCK